MLAIFVCTEMEQMGPTGFIGVDLSWKCRPFKEKATAICFCDLKGRMKEPFLVTSDEEIMETVLADPDVWVGIDAPLLVPNQHGLRSGERMAVQNGLHILPTNKSFLQKSCGGVRAEALVDQLQKEGFTAATIATYPPRSFFETYPYSLVYRLAGHGFNYKKGKAEEKRKGCQEILLRLQGWEPSINVPENLFSEAREAKASELKQVADKVDAVLCAACLYAHWLYGGQRTRLVGDEKDGYILIV